MLRGLGSLSRSRQPAWPGPGFPNGTRRLWAIVHPPTADFCLYVHARMMMLPRLAKQRAFDCPDCNAAWDGVVGWA